MEWVEPKRIIILADEKYCLAHGLVRGNAYPTKYQYRDKSDTSRIVYVKSPYDPEEKRLVAFTEDEYKIVD